MIGHNHYTIQVVPGAGNAPANNQFMKLTCGFRTFLAKLLYTKKPPLGGAGGFLAIIRLQLLTVLQVPACLLPCGRNPGITF